MKLLIAGLIFIGLIYFLAYAIVKVGGDFDKYFDGKL